jgi:hypothetical protein
MAWQATSLCLADFDTFGLSRAFRTNERETWIHFKPEVTDIHRAPSRQTVEDWHVGLSSNSNLPVFEAHWTEVHYRHKKAERNDVVKAWTEDFARIPFPQGNPLNDFRCSGRDFQLPYSHYGLQIFITESDQAELIFPFPSLGGVGQEAMFAVKLYGAAEWECPWDDMPGTRYRSLPNGWILRRRNSSADLRKIRLKSNDSRVFALSVQGPYIGAGSYGSILCLYYAPKPGQKLNASDAQRTLLQTVIPGKLRALKAECAQKSNRPALDRREGTTSSEHFTALASATDSLLTLLSPATVERPSPSPREEQPRRALQAKASNKKFFSDLELRPSQLYGSFLFQEAVYAHAYTRFHAMSASLLPLLANLVWDQRAKGNELKKYCQSRFNTQALPQALQDLLFNPNAPFARLRFQVNIQPYMPGEQKIHCLRPHYAVANMPCQRGAKDLVCGLFAMRLYGAQFANNANEQGTSHFTAPLPSGFCLKKVHTHTGNGADDRIWIASPNNCPIAGTDNHDVSCSFFSVVMGKCMQYCKQYSDQRPWDSEVTAIVTLHILLENKFDIGDMDSVQSHSAANITLPELVAAMHAAWENRHGNERPKPKNPFMELHALMGH